MKTRLLSTLLLAGVATSASAARRETAADSLAGRVPGKPARCIGLSQVQGPQILDDGSILYRESGRRVWKTRPIGQCPMRPLDTLIVDTWGGQVCRNDRFRTLTPGLSIPSAYCRFDAFTPYDKP